MERIKAARPGEESAPAAGKAVLEDVTHSWAQPPAWLTVRPLELSEPPLQEAVGQGMFLTHPLCAIFTCTVCASRVSPV